jgi:hypothetical protein
MAAQHHSHSALPQLNARRLRPLLEAKLNLWMTLSYSERENYSVRSIIALYFKRNGEL